MKTARGFTLSALTAAALSVALPHAAPAFQFNETIVVRPIVQQTFVSGVTHVDGWTCGIFACFTSNGLIPDAAASVLLSPFSERIAVGYDFFDGPGTNPCPCGSFGLALFRGAVSFRTKDIPDNFLTATLVLDPLHVASFGSHNANMINGLFETQGKTVTFSDPISVSFLHSFNRPFFTFDRRHDRWTMVSGGLGDETASAFPKEGNQTSNPVFSTFPVNATANSHPVTRNGNAYRIDVSSTVRDWIANWPNRLDTPLHGFLLTGQNFTPDEVKKAANGFIEGTFLIQYGVTLEIVLSEPDL